MLEQPSPLKSWLLPPSTKMSTPWTRCSPIWRPRCRLITSCRRTWKLRIRWPRNSCNNKYPLKEGINAKLRSKGLVKRFMTSMMGSNNRKYLAVDIPTKCQQTKINKQTRKKTTSFSRISNQLTITNSRKCNSNSGWWLMARLLRKIAKKLIIIDN